MKRGTTDETRLSEKQGQGDYEPGQQSFMLFDGSDVPKADGCGEKRVAEIHSMHLDNTFEVDTACITQTAVCAYEGCKKEFVPREGDGSAFVAKTAVTSTGGN